MGTKWKEIIGIPGYEVSRSGHVRNSKTKKVLAENVNGSSSRYLRVTIGKKHYIVHRLVALNWIPKPQGYDEVDHINRDKTDNSVSNLRWVNHKMNIDYLYVSITMMISGKKPRRRNVRKQKGESSYGS